MFGWESESTGGGKLNAYNRLTPATKNCGRGPRRKHSMTARVTRPLFLLFILTSILSAMPFALAQTAAEDETAIRSAITSQAGEWNKGNIDGFMQAYENSDQTIFVGQAKHQGYAEVLNRYKAVYNGPEEMGKLTFSDIDIRLIPTSCGKTELAIATGKYHLDNTTKPKKDGVFSLVWRKGPNGWKIILDHTS
jgi:ketosteroid isomerase-like protein